MLSKSWQRLKVAAVSAVSVLKTAVMKDRNGKQLGEKIT